MDTKKGNTNDVRKNESSDKKADNSRKTDHKSAKGSEKTGSKSK